MEETAIPPWGKKLSIIWNCFKGKRHIFLANIDFSWCPMMPLNFPKQQIGVLTARYGDIDLTPMGPKNDKYVISWYIKKKSR